MAPSPNQHEQTQKWPVGFNLVNFIDTEQKSSVVVAERSFQRLLQALKYCIILQGNVSSDKEGHTERDLC